MNTIIKKIKLKDKKYILSLAIVLVGMLSLLGGTSYAILKGSATSTKQQIIKTGKIELKLTENYESISKKMSVMSDVDGLSQDDVYEFTLKNIGDAAAKYELKLVNEVPSSYTGQVLDTKYIKIGLEINGEEYGPMSLEKVKNVIDSDILYKTEIITYKLRVWLDSSKEEEIGNLEDYKVFLKLKVEAEQRPSSIDGGVTETFVYTGNTQKYIVPRDGKYKIELWGASGNNDYNSYTKANPSYGGYTSGNINLNAGEILYFNVGGMAQTFNCCSKQGANAGSGGATDVRIYDNGIKPSNKYRYVRNYINGSSLNDSSHWVEIKVYDESGNVISNGKNVTYNGSGAHYGGTATTPNAVTDGNTTSNNYFGLIGSADSYVEIDLASDYIISKVEVWHYYSDSRVYKDQKTVLLTSEKKISDVIYTSSVNGTYAETSSGKSMSNIYLIKDLTSRIMVAGGSGGSYKDSTAAAGSHAGGLSSQAVSHSSYPIYSATQTEGGKAGYNGTAGSFGFGGTNSSSHYNSGGGGYYGGGSSPGSGGGSSYISGHTGCVAVVSNSSITPKSGCSTGTSSNACSIHYSNKVFTDTIMIDGGGYSWTNTKGSKVQMPKVNGTLYTLGVGNQGDGAAKITYLG